MECNKIAIMTWYTYKNYGSVLQASALCHVANTMGYAPELIHYPPKGGIVLKGNMQEFFERGLRKVLSLLNPSCFSGEHNKLFSEFIDCKTACSEKCVSYPELNDLNDKYSAFICGSDQIWSPLCYDENYFLTFVKNNSRMIAYAPSFGSAHIQNESIRKRIAEHVSRFNHLSVREQQGAKLIKELTGQDAKVVLDPTLLMNSQEWDMYADTDTAPKIKDKKYIICYFLGESGKYMGYVKNLSKRTGMPYFVIPITAKQKKSSNAVPFEVGPQEFVSLICNAAYVCTDSFHGMAFSINYNVPFSVFKRFRDNDPKNQNSRVISLLDMLGLSNRLVDYNSKNAYKADLSCDFSDANERLAQLRSSSADYLRSALYDAVNSNDIETGNKEYKIADMCCGCGACSSVCNKGAISIVQDADGFEHYSIDPNRCVRCGQCKNVCPMTGISAPYIKNSLAMYSMKSKSESVLKISSSGGIGHELATTLLNKGYAVCGCMYDNVDNSAKHIWIMPDENEKLSYLQGSKYIQSKSSDALKQITSIAKTHNVAFFGTPCQAAAADKLLRKNGLRENSIIVDLICHGVPTQHLWNKYLKDIDKKYGTGKHPAVLFRTNDTDWHKRKLRICGNGKSYAKFENIDDFYAFFRRGLCYMRSCSDCPYRERSAADLRIGDYWGECFKCDKQGVSMVIANTVSGDKVVNYLQGNTCDAEKQDLSEYWSVQYPYNPPYPLVREQLIYELKSHAADLHQLRKKYCSYYDRTERMSKVLHKVKELIKGR